MYQSNPELMKLQQEQFSVEQKLKQLQHKQQRLEKRKHRISTSTRTLERSAPEIKELTLSEVIEVLEIIFSYPEAKSTVHNWVLLHKQKYGEVDSGGTVPLECDTD